MGLKSLLASQSRKPTGFIGKLMGKIMNKNNKQMNNMVFKLLHIKEKDCVLEIGFGNGKYIKEIIKSVKVVSVYGLNFSETMVQIATKVNSSYVKQGRVVLSKGRLRKFHLKKKFSIKSSQLTLFISGQIQSKQYMK